MQWNTITIVIIKNVKNHLFSTNAYQYKLYKSCYSITIMLFFNLFGLIIQSLLNEFNESSYLIGYSINKQYLKTVKKPTHYHVRQWWKYSHQIIKQIISLKWNLFSQHFVFHISFLWKTIPYLFMNWEQTKLDQE